MSNKRLVPKCSRQVLVDTVAFAPNTLAAIVAVIPHFRGDGAGLLGFVIGISLAHQLAVWNL